MAQMTPCLPNIKSVRVWGREIRRGPPGLEATVEIANGSRPVLKVDEFSRFAVMRVSAERKVRLASEKVILSAWVRFPVAPELSSEISKTGVRQFKVLQRWLRIRMFRILKEYADGSA